MSAFATLPALSRLSFIIDALCKAVAARTTLPKIDRKSETVLPIPLVMLVLRRLRRAEALILSLAARLRAGRLRPFAPRAKPTPPATPRRKPTAPAFRAPRHFAWLCPLVPCDAVARGNHLRILLEEPEMQALLAASPRAVRLLRPIYRMLAIEAPVLTRPKIEGRISEAQSATATLNAPEPSRTAPAEPASPPTARLLVPI